mmetsp:Transcript_1252/g.3519  ORF Transcript_1252/g.3519 Transcript_1252/m.3519 type:complete len:95 (+) Transcript_1252:124-408(+)
MCGGSSFHCSSRSSPARRMRPFYDGKGNHCFLSSKVAGGNPAPCKIPRWRRLLSTYDDCTSMQKATHAAYETREMARRKPPKLAQTPYEHVAST